MRAVLEGLADRSADIVAFLEETSGRPFERVIAVGHPPQIPLWRELRQARYGRPMVVVEQPEMAAYGAATARGSCRLGSPRPATQRQIAPAKL